jgi:hypothetical protein
MKQVKRKYIPDVSAYMSQCEMNYALMERLLRGLAPAARKVDCAVRLSKPVVEARQENAVRPPFTIDSSIKDLVPVKVTLLDKARFTTTLELTVTLSDSQWVSPMVFTVRLYHDAKMAEVLESGRNHAPQPRFDYPDQVRHYPDDKFQRNQLLNQCLNRCFDVGAKTVTLAQVTDFTQGS